MRGGFWLLKLESPEVGWVSGLVWSEWLSDVSRIWFPFFSLLYLPRCSHHPRRRKERPSTDDFWPHSGGDGVGVKPLRAAPFPQTPVLGHRTENARQGKQAFMEGDKHWGGCQQPLLLFCGWMFYLVQCFALTRAYKNPVVCYLNYFLEGFVRKTCFLKFSSKVG